MAELASLPTPMEDLLSVADEMAETWDKGMKAGKLLAALEGRITKYDPRVTRIRAALGQTQTGAAEAIEKGVRAGIDAAISGISASAFNTCGECDRRGCQDPETGEVPCDGEEDRGCTCAEITDFANRAIKNLRSAYVNKIVARALAALSADTAKDGGR